MKYHLYLSSSWLFLLIVILIICGVFIYFGTISPLPTWFDDYESRSFYYMLVILTPLLIIMFLYDVYRYITRKHLVIDSSGITDKFTFRNKGYIPWENIGLVKIQVRNNTGIMRIYLNKPINNKDSFNIGHLRISRDTLKKLLLSFKKINKSKNLALYGNG